MVQSMITRPQSESLYDNQPIQKTVYIQQYQPPVYHQFQPPAQQVIKEVPVEVIKEVIKEVQVEVIKEVIKEVPVEVIKIVVKEVPLFKEVIKEVPYEVIKEIIREVPVYNDEKEKWLVAENNKLKDQLVILQDSLDEKIRIHLVN